MSCKFFPQFITSFFNFYTSVSLNAKFEIYEIWINVFLFYSLCFYVLFKKFCQVQGHQDFLLDFFSKTFVILDLTFRFTINLELISVYGVK